MGKKRVATQSQEELLQENKDVEARVTQEGSQRGPAKQAKEGRVYIYSSYNNTIMSLTDERGNVIAQVSAGKIGFKGSKKSTPFAASKVAEAIAQIALSKNVGKLDIFIKGVGPGRESAMRSLSAKGVELLGISDVTPIPHNGPRAPRARRV